MHIIPIKPETLSPCCFLGHLSIKCVSVLPAVFEPVGELLWNEGRLRTDSAL